MQTERYIVIFTGLDERFVNKALLSFFWDEAATKEYMQSNIYPIATMQERELICGKITGCDLEKDIYVFSSIRNPGDYPNKDKYFDAIKNVVLRVKEQLGDPYVSFAVENINFTLLTKM